MLEEVEGVGVDLSGPAIKRCLFRVPSSKGRHSNSSDQPEVEPRSVGGLVTDTVLSSAAHPGRRPPLVTAPSRI